MYTKAWERENKGRRKKTKHRPTITQMTTRATLKDALPPSMLVE
jgi:hypothetical protein